MNEPAPLDYRRAEGRPLRETVAWVPAIALACVAASPLVHLWCFDSLTLRDIGRDFGLKSSAASQRSYDFLIWYGPGYGWVWVAIAIVALAFALPRIGRWARPADGKSIAIWLLAGTSVSLAILLCFAQTANGVEEFRNIITGISTGGGKR